MNQTTQPRLPPAVAPGTPGRAAGLWPTVAGGGILLAVAALDGAVTGRALADEGAPRLDIEGLARSAAIALGAVLSMVGWRRLAVTGLAARPEPPAWLEDRVAASISGVVAVAAALLVLVDPGALTTLASEDHVVEWLSAVLAFVAAGLVGAALMIDGRGPPHSAPTMRRLTLAILAGTLLLLGLEEISWFQRVLDVESPEVFVNRNGQQEINLHNLATTATGQFYFVGGFLLGVAGPALLGDRRLPARLRWAEFLVPPRAVLYATAVAGALVYEMWNVIWIQAIFWATFPPLLRSPAVRRLGVAMATTMVLVAAVFVARGERMGRAWDDTEVRELIIPFGLAVYGLSIFRNTRHRPPAALPE